MRVWTSLSFFFLALAVTFGAFGAHALKDSLDAYSIGIYEKAVLYHFLHALGMLAVCSTSASRLIRLSAARKACALLAIGVILFSGSLYALALSGLKTLGAITPFGGSAFIAAWLMLSWESLRNNPEE